MQLADQIQTAEEGFGTENDRYTVNLKLTGEHVEIMQILRIHFQECCPALLMCHAKMNTAKRAFFNVIETGMPLHLDGGVGADEHEACMALVVHFSTREGDTTPVKLLLPALNIAVSVLPGHMYCFPGSFLVHGTEYTPVAGIERYSCVVHLKMPQKVGGVPMNVLFHEYYMC
jgi:hypothetical protein